MSQRGVGGAAATAWQPASLGNARSLWPVLSAPRCPGPSSSPLQTCSLRDAWHAHVSHVRVVLSSPGSTYFWKWRILLAALVFPPPTPHPPGGALRPMLKEPPCSNNDRANELQGRIKQRSSLCSMNEFLSWYSSMSRPPLGVFGMPLGRKRRPRDKGRRSVYQATLVLHPPAPPANECAGHAPPCHSIPALAISAGGLLSGGRHLAGAGRAVITPGRAADARPVWPLVVREHGHRCSQNRPAQQSGACHACISGAHPTRPPPQVVPPLCQIKKR